MLEPCYDCLRGQVEKIAIATGVAEKNGEAQAIVEKFIGDWPQDQTLSDACRVLGRIWPELCGEGRPFPLDPYKDIRATYNALVAGYVDEVRERVTSSDNPLLMALKYATGGNLIDFGGTTTFEPELIDSLFASIPDMEFFPDETDSLFETLDHAETLVILSDNCGELLLDKVLLETVAARHPDLDITYVTREQPILNDSITEDALRWGLDEHATVRGNTDPTHVAGTLLDLVSPGVRDLVLSADAVIAKGMGNYETLRDEHLANIWFCMMYKCPHLAVKPEPPFRGLVCTRGVQVRS